MEQAKEAKPEVKQETKPKHRLSLKMLNVNFREATYEYTVWCADANFGETAEDILDPSYWANVSPSMKPWDHIFIRAYDGTWYAELLVLGCDRTWARVHLMRHESLTTADVARTESDKFEVTWRGPRRKWGIVRLSDKTVIKDEIQTRNQAQEEMLELQKAIY